MERNRAAQLLEQIQRRATDRAHRVLLYHLLGNIPLLALPVALEWLGALIATLFLTAMFVGMTFVWHDALAGVVGQTAALYALTGRVAVFTIKEFHVVGR